MPSWYDIQISGTRDIETLAGFPEARDYFVGLLTSLSKCGRPLIAGGFSQGGAMALSRCDRATDALCATLGCSDESFAARFRQRRRLN